MHRKVLKYPDIPQKMVEYLLGKFDFYKVISIDSKKITQVLSYNLHGTLNRSSVNQSPKISVPVANLPTRIVTIVLISFTFIGLIFKSTLPCNLLLLRMCNRL